MGMTYTEGEEVILTEDVGKRGKKGFIPKDTKVKFIKVIDNPNNLSASLAVIEHEDRQLALPEVVIRSENIDYDKMLKELNNSLIKSKPDLGVHHHNFFVRTFHKIKRFFKKKETKDTKLEDLKKYINKE